MRRPLLPFKPSTSGLRSRTNRAGHGTHVARLARTAVRFCVRRASLVPIISATEARRRLYALIDEVRQSHQALEITGKRGNAVLLAEEVWRAIQETLHLVSIPGMRESILEGMATDVSELNSEPGW